MSCPKRLPLSDRRHWPMMVLHQTEQHRRGRIDKTIK